MNTPRGAAVSDAVVWLDGNGAKPNLSPVEIGQRDREFEPMVTVVSTGTRVLFPNRDKVKHHVYSFSAAKTFAIQLYSGTPAEPIVFDKPGVVVIGCNIHDWMLAYVAVVDSPWFAKTAANGHTEIANLPAGRYTVNVWHPYQKLQLETKIVELETIQSRREMKFTLDIAPPAPKQRQPVGDTY
ncbi:MAG: methylamine utilization protein [Burkholderiales bacterium]